MKVGTVGSGLVCCGKAALGALGQQQSLRNRWVRLFRGEGAVLGCLLVIAVLIAGCSSVDGSISNLPQQFSPPPTATLAVGTLPVIFAEAGNLPPNTENSNGSDGSSELAAEYIEPVSGAVVDWFRPPAHIGAPGNRGWEYETLPDTQVVAAGAGSIRFAGQVGGSLYVSINHPDGVRTTYSHVKDIAVKKGDAVKQGDVLASTKDKSFHFGVIKEGDYIDPAEVLGGAGATEMPLGSEEVLPRSSAQVRLVPLGI